MMENDIGIAETKIGERNATYSEVLERSIKENADLSLDGSKDSEGDEVFKEAAKVQNETDADLSLDGSKDTNGDEVFKEAAEAQNDTIVSENSTAEGQTVELIGTLENNNDNSDVSHGVQKIEEVIEVPNAVQSSEDAAPKNELPMNEGDHDQQISTEKYLTEESNGSVDDNIVENNVSDLEEGKGDYGDVVDSAAPADEVENASDRNEKLDNFNQKPEDGKSDKLTYAEVLTSRNAETTDADGREEVILETSEALEPNDLSRADADPKKLDTETKSYEMSEIKDANNIKGADIGSGIPENGLLDHVNFVDNLDNGDTKTADADVLKEQTYETSLETGVDDIKGRGEGPVFETESNGDALHNNEQDTILEYDHQQDKHEKNPDHPNSELQEDQVEELKEVPCASGANPKDDENTEIKKSDSELEQVENVDTRDVDEEENIGPASSDDSSDHAKESSGFDNDVHSVVEDSTSTQEIAEVEPSSSDLLPENSKSFRPQFEGADAEISTNISERQEHVGSKDEKKELHLSDNIEQAVGYVVSSSSDNFSMPGPLPVGPPGLEHAAKVQEPVPEDKSAKENHEIKHAAGITSSSTSIAPRSADVRQTSLLPEPASQNKEHVTKLAAVSLPTPAPARPAGLGRAAPLLEPASRVVQQPRVNGAVSATQNQLVEDPTNGEAEEYDETREKLQMIRVKFLRLAHRLGQTPHNVVVAQVLYRLGLAEQLHGRSGGRGAFSFDRASAMAEQLEAAGQEPLDFTCTIMVLGKSGVGKSATINSIFDENMFGTDAFQLGTKKVQDIVGTVQGIRVRVIDTPGLLPSWSDQRQNEKILRSVKNFIKKTPPDIVLYLDRLDMQSRDFGDMPLLRTITEIFGPSIWFNAIVVLTHAASAPPEGPNGTATSYDMFVTQRSHVVQQAIRQAAGDMRLMNPVSLVENHSACRTNRAGQRVLPNGQVWKPHLLLLSFASKILAEANTLLKLQDTPPGRPFAPRTRTPPLPVLLSSLLQSRPEVKLPSEQFGGSDDEDDAIEDDLDECSDSEEESEYDQLPPFKPLTKAQLEKLSKVQRKAYYDELEYREKLFMKKQLMEERKRRKMMKKMQEAVKDMAADYGENVEEETGAAASVPVPMPDLALPASFDSDNPTHRYRSLDSSNPWLVRAVLEPNGWDHDIGYDGINVERLFVVKDKVPVSFSGHFSKDKKDANLQMEIASSLKHARGKSSSVGFDMQSVGKDYAYTMRGETRFSNRKINKAAAGVSATVLGDVITGGIKLEDKLLIGRRAQIVVTGGAIYGRGDVAYGGSLEATLRDKDHPLGRFLSTIGLSVMDWHGDLAIGCNSQTQIPIGRHTNLIGRLNINNRGSGQFSVKINSSEQLQIVLVGLFPLVKKIMGYSQQPQYGY